MNTSRYLATTVLVSLLAVPALARAATIDYRTVGVFTGTSFSTGGLTVTAEHGGTLGITDTGLGVIGGADIGPFTIDTDESVLFSFAGGGATGVGFGTSAAFRDPSVSANTPIMVEGFGVGGASLGVHGFPIFSTTGSGASVDVSGAFGDVMLTGFRVAGSGVPAGVTMWQVIYTDAPQQPPAVPEPATLVLCATGLVLGGWRKCRAARLDVDRQE